MMMIHTQTHTNQLNELDGAKQQQSIQPEYLQSLKTKRSFAVFLTFLRFPYYPQLHFLLKSNSILYSILFYSILHFLSFLSTTFETLTLFFLSLCLLSFGQVYSRKKTNYVLFFKKLFWLLSV